MTGHKVKNSILTHFTFILTHEAENIRVKGAEKWLASLHDVPKKLLACLSNRASITVNNSLTLEPFIRSLMHPLLIFTDIY